MGELTDELRRFLDAHRVGGLATAAPDGKPRQSVVYYARDGDRLLVSTLSARLKARDVRSTGLGVAVRSRGRASVSVGDRLRPRGDPDQGHRATDGPDHARIAGTDELPEAQSDEALAAVDRVILAISVERVSAMSHL
jgi:Pyridoxamine 5'-phosphate oxidase